MKNLQQKQQPKSKSINSFKAGLDSLPILAAKANMLFFIAISYFFFDLDDLIDSKRASIIF